MDDWLRMVQSTKKQKLSHNVAGQENVLEQILKQHNISWTEFVDEYFEKKPLLLRQCNQKYGSISTFSKEALLQLTETHDLEPSQMTVCKYVDQERQNLPLEENEITRDLLDKSFRDGYSVQFYQPQRYMDELFTVNTSFERQFGALAGSSAYLTPPGAQALAPHYDDVEVFVLQTEGKKKWKVYAPIDELPAEHSGDLEEDDLTELVLDVELSPGDVLYFPRGFIHQAIALPDEFSTHVTVSVYQYNTWGNFMEIAIPRLLRNAFENNKAFREGLPVNYLSYMGTQYPTGSKAQEFTNHFQDLLRELTDEVLPEDLHQAADEASLDFFTNRLPPEQKSNDKNGTKFRVLDPSHFRVMVESGEDGDLQVKVIHSCKNERENHMGQGSEPRGIGILYDGLPVILHLLESFPKFESIEEVSKKSDVSQEIVESVVSSLLSQDVVEYET